MNKKEILENIKKEAIDNHVPIIEDEPLKLIEVLLKIKKPNRILEVGTAVGYSAINFSKYLEGKDCKIKTIEIKEAMYNKAMENISLMNLNDKQLYECGLEIKQGKSKKYIKEKYHLTDSSYLEISRGKRWSFYTKIAPFDEHIDESNTVVNRYQVDKIIFLFKHKQTIKDISKEIGISYNTIVKILKGEMWRNYTGIIDESFYIFYSNKQKEEETNKILYIIELNKNGKTYKEISDLMGMPLSTIKGILSGRTHSDITKIKWKPGKERMDNGEFKNLKLNKNKVLNNSLGKCKKWQNKFCHASPKMDVFFIIKVWNIQI